MKILIVEDEFIIAMDMKMKLEELGYQVIGIKNSGEQAIKKIQESKPHLILMDVLLKGEMDGIDATHEIWNRFKIPVLYITAHSDKITISRIEESPCQGFLNKPVNADELKTGIERALIKPPQHVTNKIKSSRIPKQISP